MDRQREKRRQRQLPINQNDLSSEVGSARPSTRRSVRVEDAAVETIDNEIAQQRQQRLPETDAADGQSFLSQTLRRNLATRGALRQAILLSDILGPPKALRGPEDS